MNILAIDTTTNACSAAVLTNNVTHEDYELAPRAHTQLLLPMIERVLQTAEIKREALDAVAYINGPGSFTGIRIATSVAQGISLGLGIPVIPVSSLLVLACGARRETDCLEILPCIDARRGQIYWAHYSFDTHANLPRVRKEDTLGAASELLSYQPPGSLIFGTGFDEADVPPRYPRAGDALQVAAQRLAQQQTNAPGEATAVYFRRGL